MKLTTPLQLVFQSGMCGATPSLLTCFDGVLLNYAFQPYSFDIFTMLLMYIRYS